MGHNKVQVTSIETGITHTMTKDDFYNTFGKLEGEKMLQGYHPHITAVKIPNQSMRGNFINEEI